MKKPKMLLTSLCAGILLFSAIPSFATKKPSNITNYEEKAELAYEQKVKRIVDYLERRNEVSDPTVIPPSFESYGTYNVPSISYGLHTVAFFYTRDLIGGRDHLTLGIFKGTQSSPFSMDKADILLYDFKNNNYYGSLDRVCKKEDKYVELTEEEEKKFNLVYQNIVDKFYSENKNEIFEERQMKNLFETLEKK